MPQTPPADLLRTDPPPEEQPAPHPARHSTRSWLLLGLLVLVLLLTILPPLVSISRYQRRVATSISQVLGRPVHLDHVALNLLPFPSLTLSNLVIDELPPFGMEPIVRAGTVNARLRLLPLWRHRVEFSRITFTDPSVNLVRRSSGQWNLESVLLQAAHIDAAPTAQHSAGGQPRFPYIEATGARVNLKLDGQKTPFSLTEANFALWLPQPREWRVRLSGHPSRTDTAASDTGTVQVEATLQRAPAVGQVPLSLDGSWTGAPLGEASRVVSGHDAGLRGDLRLTTHLQGTLSHASLDAELVLSGLHRVDLVPDRPVNVDLACRAVLTRLLHTAEDLHCAWPLEGASSGGLRADGAIPDLLAPASADLRLSADRIPAGTVLRWMRSATSTLPPDLHATGQIAAEAVYPGTDAPATATIRVSDLALSGASLHAVPVIFSPILLTASLSGLGGDSPSSSPQANGQGIGPPGDPIGGSSSSPENRQAKSPLTNTSTPSTNPQTRVPMNPQSGPQTNLQTDPDPGSPERFAAAAELSMAPATIHLAAAPDPSVDQAPQDRSGSQDRFAAPNRFGTQNRSGTQDRSGTQTASGTQAGSGAQELVVSLGADRQGLSARLAGTVTLSRLDALAASLPPLGEGLRAALPPDPGDTPVPVDLTAYRPWGGPQHWTDLQNTPANKPSSRPKPSHP